MMDMLKKLYRDEEGQALSEYGLILALVAVAAVVGLTTIGGKLEGIFKDIADKLQTKGGSGE
ncbi:Flp family type IVb pilin [Aneurinibacillus sp. REN35]|uniref:Flp family type IVb pilin n=1 Tax=Aneurinibacillus sp. REN35 TaxID=3237286 RepID=UPI0035282F0E